MIGTSPRRRAGIVIVTALLASACATGHSANRFIRGGGSKPVELMETPVPAAPALSEAAVEAAVTKARLSPKTAATKLPTIEGTDEELSGALRLLRDRPSAATHVRVGQAYARLGVRDFAIEHFDSALRYNSRSAAAYDGRARIWRDWHLPGLGLGDSYRAVRFAPKSPVTHNTLGTVLQALGQCAAAEAAFRRALSLDPRAAYAVENLRWIEQNRGTGACRDAGRSTTASVGEHEAHSPNEEPGASHGRDRIRD